MVFMSLFITYLLEWQKTLCKKIDVCKVEYECKRGMVSAPLCLGYTVCLSSSLDDLKRCKHSWKFQPSLASLKSGSWISLRIAEHRFGMEAI